MIAALVGIACREPWRGRAVFVPTAWSAGMVAVVAVRDHVLPAREAEYPPWLKSAVVAIGLVLTTTL